MGRVFQRSMFAMSWAISALLASGALWGSSTPEAVAAIPLASTASEQEIARAREIMNMSYQEFARLPHEGPFEWSNDGCSSPMPADPYREYFQPACVQHDFGYRNFGGHYGKGYGTDRRTKNWIDAHFRDEMQRICDSRPDVPNPTPGAPSSRVYCYNGLTSYYYAVRDRGDSSYFTGL